ncbi:FAD-dependent monooxygenase [Lentzea sp. NPDC006480]|uniref:FAD-dependent monooxygenase n=1 Tax=Lentzea sp. NPDC006480 TaxID=3157176 RepID=UPI0033A17FC2
MVSRVVVAGGGIGGLATAVALHQRGIPVVVLERAPEFREIGAGLSLWPNAMRALDSLGLAAQVRAAGAVETGGGVRDRAGRWLSRTDNAAIERRHGWPLVVVHRAELLRILVSALPASSLRPDSEVHAVAQDGSGVSVTHRGGSEHADLVVAADGLNSILRRQWWPRAAGPRYVGCTGWRAVTKPLPRLEVEGAVLWGRGERAGFTVLPGSRYYVFGAVTAPRGAAFDFPRHFAGWPDPLPALLAAVPDGAVIARDVHDLPPLPTYVCGRVVLLGDAAHAMNPILGQGACQALEDAVTLAACLDGPDVDTALERYDRVRRPRTQSIVRRSARLDAVAQWTWPPAVLARDLGARLTPARATLRAMEPVLGWTVG